MATEARRSPEYLAGWTAAFFIVKAFFRSARATYAGIGDRRARDMMDALLDGITTLEGQDDGD